MLGYVINLDRDDARRRELVRHLAATDLRHKDIRRFRGVDGGDEDDWADAQALVDARAMRKMAVIQARGYSDSFGELVSPGAACCALSHLCVWSRVLHDARLGAREPVLVLEDDAHFVTAKPGAVISYVNDHAPRDWHVMLLGFKLPDPAAAERGTEFDRPRFFFGLHAYLINKAGARAIFGGSRVLPLHMQGDVLLSRLAQRGRINMYSLKRSIAFQLRGTSRVQLDRAKQLAHGAPNFRDFAPVPEGPTPTAQMRELARLAA
jgi:GR25 family glycosyltransferase involved in LPS biosynthesis